MNPAEEGFPWERVEAAKRYLYLVKPWWSRFGERLQIVPVYQPPQPGTQYGATCSTDQGMRLYVDRTYAAVAPFHILAGSLAHEFHHHTHDTWNRLRWLDPDTWRKWAGLALDLEINGVIDREARNLDLADIRILASRSGMFTEREMDVWEVAGPPTVDDAVWTPRLVGLPDGLSAEEYLDILIRADQARERAAEAGDINDEEQPQAEPDQAPGDSPETQEDGADSAQDDADDAPDDCEQEGQEGQESQEGEQGQDGDADEGAATDDQNEPDAQPSEAGEPSSGPAPADTGQGGPEADEPDVEDQPAAQPQEGSGQPAGQAGQQAEMADAQGAQAQGGDPASGLEDAAPDLATAELGQRVEELRAAQENQAWATELVNPDDDLAEQGWKPPEQDNAEYADRGVMDRAFTELREDVLAAGDGPLGFGSGPGSGTVNWARRQQRIRGLNWEARFARLVSSAYTSKVAGQSDMSYSVRNPNQGTIGPILQGMHAYAPTIYVIQDVSGSMLMNDAMNRSQTLFTDLAKTVLGRFSARVTWVTVDAGVVAVGRASSWTPDLEATWGKGYGGTDLASSIHDVMTNQFVWEGRRQPKADLLIVSTDCIFRWPELRPSRGCKVLVVNVGTEERAARFLPRWLNRRQEYVCVG